MNQAHPAGSGVSATPGGQRLAHGSSDDQKMNVSRLARMSRRPRLVSVLAAVLLAGAVIAGVPETRHSILRSAGWVLVAHDPLEPADIIVITLGADRAGVLEAADLVHVGIAQRVAVFADPPNSADREFLRRGIPYEDAAARSTRQLRVLGVTTIEQIPRVNGTEAEGQVLPRWCDQHQFRSVVVVSAGDHSRRLRRVLDRAMRGHPTKIMVRPARHSTFDPDRWWESRDGARTMIIELQKLLFDIVRHPLS